MATSEVPEGRAVRIDPDLLAIHQRAASRLEQAQADVLRAEGGVLLAQTLIMERHHLGPRDQMLADGQILWAADPDPVSPPP
jgi:hypothetical protein